MGLEGIFDPMVRAHFAGNGGGNSGDSARSPVEGVVWVKSREYETFDFGGGAAMYKSADTIDGLENINKAIYVVESVTGQAACTEIMVETEEDVPGLLIFSKANVETGSGESVAFNVYTEEAGLPLGFWLVDAHGDFSWLINRAYILWETA